MSITLNAQSSVSGKLPKADIFCSCICRANFYIHDSPRPILADEAQNGKKEIRVKNNVVFKSCMCQRQRVLFFLLSGRIILGDFLGKEK